LKPRKPYLLRAIHEWISESDCTPHLVVDAGETGVDVPRQFVRDGRIILNISWNATAALRMDADWVSFSGRFGGTAMNVRVPMAAILAIYAKETGQGMIFGEEDGEPPPATTPETPPEPPAGPPPGGARARLKVVK
jgi:stringent starvation protein B